MNLIFSSESLSCFHCAVKLQIDNLQAVAKNAVTEEFRTLCEDEINAYKTALAELNNYLKIK